MASKGAITSLEQNIRDAVKERHVKSLEQTGIERKIARLRNSLQQTSMDHDVKRLKKCLKEARRSNFACQRKVIEFNYYFPKACEALSKQDTRALCTAMDAKLPKELCVLVYQHLFAGWIEIVPAKKTPLCHCSGKCYDSDEPPCADYILRDVKYLKDALRGTSMLTEVASTWYSTNVLICGYWWLFDYILHIDVWEAGLRPMDHIRALNLELNLLYDGWLCMAHFEQVLRSMVGLRQNVKVCLSIRYINQRSLPRYDSRFVRLAPFFRMTREMRDSGLNMLVLPYPCTSLTGGRDLVQVAGSLGPSMYRPGGPTPLAKALPLLRESNVFSKEWLDIAEKMREVALSSEEDDAREVLSVKDREWYDILMSWQAIDKAASIKRPERALEHRPRRVIQLIVTGTKNQVHNARHVTFPIVKIRIPKIISSHFKGVACDHPDILPWEAFH
ncbi:hypothetical protein BDU57DRAFT_564692 [Ampelomyces quisqualis]|uniref:Uncharacterized protein n=1 Tax=Ampelomyces quisqualis TaxID=50730 RepID=A0A6A5QB56_AMPQU|nr:hypothetical protein BDU57DRAFT_564692 [Ampelomyces quisqualis]